MPVTQTPRVGLNKWGAGTDPYTRAQHNADQDQLELLTAIDVQGTLAARPAAGTRGRYYFATDNGILYRDTGVAWVTLNPPASAIPFAATSAPTTMAAGDSAGIGADTTHFALADHRHGAVTLTGLGGVAKRADVLGGPLLEGTDDDFTYDGSGRLSTTTLKTQAGVRRADEAYTYDGSGRVSTITKRIYGDDGASVISTVTEVVTYDVTSGLMTHLERTLT
jgi:hypothetical protein